MRIMFPIHRMNRKEMRSSGPHSHPDGKFDDLSMDDRIQLKINARELGKCRQKYPNRVLHESCHPQICARCLTIAVQELPIWSRVTWLGGDLLGIVR